MMLNVVWCCCSLKSIYDEGRDQSSLGSLGLYCFPWHMARDSILPTFISSVLASPLCSLCVLMFHIMFYTPMPMLCLMPWVSAMRDVH